MATAKDKFLAVYPDGEGGQVAYLDTMEDVKLAAYKLLAWCQLTGHVPTSTTFLSDCIKVEAPGCAPITYVVDKTTARAAAA